MALLKEERLLLIKWRISFQMTIYEAHGFWDTGLALIIRTRLNRRIFHY